MTSVSHLRHPSYHRSWVEVDLDAIRDNARAFRRLAGPTVGLMPEVKADAYGHGAIAVARVLLEEGCARLAVATVLEGEELRAAGIAAPVHILGASLPEEIAPALRNDLTLSLHDMGLAELISLEASRCEKVANVHLKVDTGMGRLGVLPENVVEAARTIISLPGLELEGVFMHFADAADAPYSLFQLDQFKKAIHALEEAGIHVPIRHAASSIASILYKDAHFDLIRPGAGIYGFHSPGWVGEQFAVTPAMSWRCVVIQVKDYPVGLSLGYNRTFTTRRPTRIAVLPVGYADGYMIGFSNHASVLIHGHRAPVVGMISMDYAMADVTGMSGVKVGTEVTLIGEDGNDRITVEELAAWGGTIPYTITTCLGRRPGRCYVATE